MIARMSFAASIAVFTASALAAVEIQFTPGAGTEAYRKVLIAPAQVEFNREFFEDAKPMPGQPRRFSPNQVEALSREMGESFRNALVDAFRRHGFEIALAPGNDVLRISPALKDLNVNTPKGPRPWRFYARKAGEATMVVEGSDASGARLLRASRQATAGETAALQPASDASNRFWFDAMFRDWAEDLVSALAGAK